MIYAIAFILLMPVMWVLYLAVMHLDTARRRNALTPAAKVVGYPILFVGLAEHMDLADALSAHGEAIYAASWAAKDAL